VLEEIVSMIREVLGEMEVASIAAIVCICPTAPSAVILRRFTVRGGMAMVVVAEFTVLTI
jgi:hypothetical protein